MRSWRPPSVAAPKREIALSRRLRCPSGTPSFFEIAVRQLGQDIGVDFTLAKERLVLSEAEASEPTPDIHGRIHGPRTDHPLV